MVGRVIKFYNSFFFVKVEDELIPCKLRGLIKRDKKVGSAVYPGDLVEISRLADNSGVIEKILPRKSLLSRPAVANVDKVILTFAAKSPDLNKLLLNKFITLAEFSNLGEIIICVNKIDLVEEKNFLSEYETLYKIIRTSTINDFGIDELEKILSRGVSVFAGSSGVGKSSLLNKIIPKINLKVGKVSEKILRGKHTTRISELIEFGNGFVVDTPGFSAIDLSVVGKKNLRNCFKEFTDFAKDCKFLNTCTHTHEPDCKVKSAVERGEILRERYESYLSMFKELEK